MPSITTKQRAAKTPYQRPIEPSAASSLQQGTGSEDKHSKASPSFLQSFLSSVFHRNTKSKDDLGKPKNTEPGLKEQKSQDQNFAKETKDGGENPSAKLNIGFAAGNVLVDAALAELRSLIADQEGVLDAQSIIKMYSDKVLGMDRSLFEPRLHSESEQSESTSDSESGEDDVFAAGPASTSLQKATHSLSPNREKVAKRRRTALPALTESAILRSENTSSADLSTSARILSGSSIPVIPTSRPRPVLTLKPLPEAGALELRKDRPGVVCVDFDLSDDDDDEELEITANAHSEEEPKTFARPRRPKQFPAASSQGVEKALALEPARNSYQMSSKSPFYTSNLFGPASKAALESATAPKALEPAKPGIPENSEAKESNATEKQPAASAAPASAAASTASAVPAAPDLFGASAVTPPATAPTTSTGFSFGATAEDKKAPAASTGFSFGAPAKDKEVPAATSSGFTFGAKKEEKSATSDLFAKPESKPSLATAAAPFTFGQNATTTTTTNPAKSTTPTNPSGFSFGQTAPAASSGLPKPPSTLPAAPATFSGFSFTQPASKQPENDVKAAAGINFGGSLGQAAGKRSLGDDEPATKKPLFGTTSSNANGTTPATSSTAKPAELNSLFGSSDKSTKPFAFGAGTETAQAKPQSGFSFPVASTTSEAPKSTGLFGSSKPEASKIETPSSLFGASLKPSTADSTTASAPAPAPAAKPGVMSFSFGASSDKPAQAAQPAQPKPASTTGFTFGASAKPAEPAASTAFGSSAPQPANIFGSNSLAQTSQPASAAPAAPAAGPGAFSFTSSQNPPASFGSQPSLGFGANTASAPGSISGFGANSASAPGSTSGFTFGSSSSAAGPQMGTQPAQQSASNTFGTPNFNFGASNTPQFGASAPPASQQPNMFGANANANANPAQPNLFASSLDNGAVARRPMARPVRRLNRR